MNWFIYAIITAISFTAYNLLSRLIAVKSDNPRAFSIVYNTIAAIFSLPLLFIEPSNLHSISLWLVFLTFLATVCYAVYDRSQFYASKHTEASLLTIIFRITPVVTIFLSFVFLKETINFNEAVGIFLIILGNVIAVYKNINIKINKGFLYAIIAAIGLGAAYTFDKRVSSAYSLPIYTFIAYLVPSLYNLVTPPLPIKVLRKEIILAGWKVIYLPLTSLIGYYCLLKAFSYADAARVVPVTSISSILTVLAGILLLKEKSNIARKIIAAAMVFIGLYFVR